MIKCDNCEHELSVKAIFDNLMSFCPNCREQLNIQIMRPFVDAVRAMIGDKDEL